jgi:hypothetical protein
LRGRQRSGSRCAGSSVACQLVGRASSGVSGAAEKVGEQFEFGVPISGADLVHRGVHTREKAQELSVPVAYGPHDDGATVGRVALAGYPSAAFESVDDAGHSSRVQPGTSCEGARAERTVASDEVETIEIDVLEIKVCADAPLSTQCELSSNHCAATSPKTRRRVASPPRTIRTNEQAPNQVKSSCSHADASRKKRK